MLKLCVEIDGQTGSELSFDQDKVVIGSGRGADVDLGVGPPRLATVFKVGRQYYLVKNGSQDASLDKTPLLYGLSYPLRQSSELVAGACRVQLNWRAATRPVGPPSARVISLDLLDDEIDTSDVDLGGFMSRALLQATRRLAGKATLEELADDLARLALRIVGSADRTLVRLTETDRSDPRTFVCRDAHGEEADENVFRLQEGVIWASMVSKTAMLFTEKAEGGSAVAVPLWDHVHLRGVLYLENDEGRPPFDERDALVLTLIANIAAVSVANTVLLQKLQTAERQLREENQQLQQKLERRKREFSEVIGDSPAMKPLFELMDKVVQSSVTVLVTGETGTGKERIGRAVHYNGSRKDKPFVAINCAALPESLLESELFGHAKGAFTGADQAKAGLFEQADGGTLFLDEIGDISPNIQVRLLRALQEGEVRRVGAISDVKVDVRLISATHRNLEARVREGLFREDLLYRLNIITLNVPPLRERREDIPRLVQHFLSMYGRDKDIRGVTPAAMDLLMAYDYPGNIRELENEMQRAVVIAPSRGIITPESLSTKFHREDGITGSFATAASADGRPLRALVGEFERAVLVRALDERGWNRSKTARDLGLSRPSFLEKLKKYEIEPPDNLH